MKSVSGQTLGGSIKDYISKDKQGLERHEFIDFYRSVLNAQKNQSEALTFVFYKVLPIHNIYVQEAPFCDFFSRIARARIELSA